MDLIDITAQKRTTKGNNSARALRRANCLPAVLYGPNTEAVSLTLPTADLELALKNKKSAQLLINLQIENDDRPTRKVMLRELQRHPLSRRFLHADLYEFDMDRKIRVNVPVTATGKSIGVEMGGMLQIIRRELEVLCLPTMIPNAIEIDITELDLGDSIHIKDLEMDGIEFPHEVNFTVLTLLAPKGKSSDEESEEDETAGENAEEETAAG